MEAEKRKKRKKKWKKKRRIVNDFLILWRSRDSHSSFQLRCFDIHLHRFESIVRHSRANTLLRNGARDFHNKSCRDIVYRFINSSNFSNEPRLVLSLRSISIYASAGGVHPSRGCFSFLFAEKLCERVFDVSHSSFLCF